MAKSRQSDDRKRGRRTQQVHLPSDELIRTSPRTQRAKKPLEAKTRGQLAYINAIDTYDLIFCKGPMGTGKSYIAAAKAADELTAGRIDKIVITRPAVEAEEELGILPGEIEEKWAPYFAPVRAILEERLGAGHVEMFLKNGKIEIAPIGHLRGHTFKDCWVIFDEAQNATPNQMKLVLTRFGENCKMIVDGDPDEQKDIPGGSGFDDAWYRMRNHPQIGMVEFGTEDIVRSGLARDILLRYRKQENTGDSVGQAELELFLGKSAD